MNFTDLPLDILPHILIHLVRPQHLANACLVNRSFYAFGIPFLYHRATIYSWHKAWKDKVAQLFKTLADCPGLARYMLRLEIRDFPKSIAFPHPLESLVLRGLGNCTNLRSFTWTRDGTLSSPILRVLASLPTLAELELNGRAGRRWDAELLDQVTGLRRLSLTMPTEDVVRRLPLCLRNSAASLTELTLICRMSPLVTDAVLVALAPHLVNLEQFAIMGCPRVTPAGVCAVLEASLLGMTSLALEGLAPKFPITTLANFIAGHPAVVARLKSVTLSVPSSTWLPSVSRMLDRAPLEAIHLYASLALTPRSKDVAAESNLEHTRAEFWAHLVAAHGHRLTRVSVHRMSIGVDTIREVCLRCERLRELFVVVGARDVARIGECLALTRCLEAIHLNFAVQSNARADGWEEEDEDDVDESDSDEERDVSANEDDLPDPHTWLPGAPGIMTAPEALSLVRRCPDTIKLFGCNARVWQVERDIKRAEDGSVVLERILGPYSGVDIPEQFLVVRT
ncbi:unnamed protein product [Mycena citricolor]|uniref:F-box domain-containing protein n=1 Tax=Mycena citricolor TaxID=2018698 RepID=A0AAD2Q6X7_9AGAR|nr:unnamed protein product [Mycena citricolor]